MLLKEGTGLLLMWGLKLDIANLGLYIGECILVEVLYLWVFNFVKNLVMLESCSFSILVFTTCLSGGTFPVENI